MKRKDIEETLKALMEVYKAAKDYLDEPSAIYKAARLQALKQSVEAYEHKYWEKFGDDDES